MSDTTVIVKTIGRPSLLAAVTSAKREGFDPIIVSDGIDISEEAAGGCRVVKLGRKWGYYGGMATNVGAAICPTEFMTLLDDDDEFVVGVGDVIRSKIKNKPHIDVWIGGVRFKEIISVNLPSGDRYQSTDLAIRPNLGITIGNVAMPTYRTEILSKLPFVDDVQKEETNYTDFLHVKKCQLTGYKIWWFEQAIYMVRPQLHKNNGEGK